VDPEGAAREAIEGGPLLEHRHDAEPYVPVAIAVDFQPLVAAAYVITRLSREWQTDVLTFARVDEDWQWRAEGGCGATDLPFERSRTDRDEGLGPVDTTVSEDDDRLFVAVGGFSTATVVAIELSIRDAVRRVEPNPITGAFVVSLALPVGPEVDFDEIDVRAIDEAGSIVDSTAAWRAKRDAGSPDTVTVLEAGQLPDGTAVKVRAQLLVLEGHPVRLCDQIDATREPPEPRGASLIVHGLSAADWPLSWTAGEPGVSVSTVVMSGTVIAGAFHPGGLSPQSRTTDGTNHDQ
jgi:hypothetical protein